jgi:hypothetical protein
MHSHVLPTRSQWYSLSTHVQPGRRREQTMLRISNEFMNDRRDATRRESNINLVQFTAKARVSTVQNPTVHHWLRWPVIEQVRLHTGVWNETAAHPNHTDRERGRTQHKILDVRGSSRPLFSTLRFERAVKNQKRHIQQPYRTLLHAFIICNNGHHGVLHQDCLW